MQRRRFLAAAGTALAAGLAGCGGRSGSTTADWPAVEHSVWPSAAHDAANSRYARGCSAPSDRRVNWRASVESAEQFPPVVTEEGVFVLGRGALYGFDRDGAERWAIPLGEDEFVFGAPTAPPGGGWVALGTGEGRLRLFDAADGSVVFERTFEEGIDASVVVPARSRELYVPTERGRLHALRRGSDGLAATWTHAAFGGVDRAPAAVPRPVVATTAGVEGLTDGGLGRWRTGLPSPPVTRPVVAGDRVVVGCADASVRALDLHTGAVVWSRDVQRNPNIQERFGAIAATPERVFVTLSRTVWALDLATGRPRWRHGDLDERFARPVVVDDALLVAGDGALYAFERDGGPGVGRLRLDPVRWRLDLDVRTRGLAVADDRAYLLGAREGTDQLLEIR